MPGNTRRLDQALVEERLVASRARAQALIAARQVTLDGVVADKASRLVPADAKLGILALDHPWVSRGGIKLAAALDHFGIDVTNLLALDIGASTGGFTDVLLQRGARKVYAVDVGHSQLADRVRHDPRVIVREQLNARYLSAADVPEMPDIIVCDVSFISLLTLLPAGLARAAPGARLVSLIKPQFEVGPQHVQKGGIVRDPAQRERACGQVADWLRRTGWSVRDVMQSPIKGSDGNVEFLLAAQYDAPLHADT